MFPLESKAFSTDGESDHESNESDCRGRRHLAIFIKSDESDFVGVTTRQTVAPRVVCLTSRRRPDATPRTDESLPPDESG